MGLDEFSMSPARVPTIKQLIRKLSKAECRQLTEQALAASDALEVKGLANKFLSERGISMG